MSHKTKMILSGIGLFILMVGLSYYQFMGVQSLLTLISKQGTLYAAMIGPSIMSIEITCLLTFLFHIYTQNKHLIHIRYKSFLLRNAWFLIISGCLACGFLAANTVAGPEAGQGATFGYPFDMLGVSLFGVVVGILAIFKAIKIDVVPPADPKIMPTKLERLKIIVLYIIYYIFAFVVFDRIGAILTNVILNVSSSTIVFMLPVFAISLALLLSLNLFELYFVFDDPKKKKLIWGVGTLVIICLAIYGIVGQIVNLLGPQSTYVMKAYSQFYGFDRLVALPVTIILISLMVIVPGIISIIKFLKGKNYKLK